MSPSGTEPASAPPAGSRIPPLPRGARVLVLARELPRPPQSGGGFRILHFVRGLARQHRVSVLAMVREPLPPEALGNFQRESGCEEVSTFAGDDIPGFAGEWAPMATFIRQLIGSPFPSYVHDFWSESLMRRLRQLYAEDKNYVVITRHPSFAEQARAAGFARVILDADDLFGVLMQQELRSKGWYKRKPLHILNAWKARRYERNAPRRFERVLIAKSDDKVFFPKDLRDRVVVVPNGVNVPATVVRTREVPNRLLFVGTLAYPPNHDAVLYLAREVLPILWGINPDVTVDIVGRGPATPEMIEALRDSRCRLHLSPHDLSPFYDEASVVVAPIRQGLGTRIKVIEALAQQKALVATSFAPEGLGLQAGVHFAAGDTPGEFARVCAELLADPARRAALAAAGREYTLANFDWKRIEESIGELVPAR